MMKKSTTLALALVAAALSGPALVYADDAHHGHGAAPAAASASKMSDGEIRKVDKGAGKVTIKHGPIENLGMPNMTMVFRVKDPAMLEQVKAGDKIRFAAEKVNGAITVTKLEAAK